MNKKNILVFTSLFLFLTSCNGTKAYSVSDYKKEMSFKGETFKILQLTDIHIGIEVDSKRCMNFCKKMIEDQKPDLVVITGDSFFDATKEHVNLFCDTLDSVSIPTDDGKTTGVPWAFTYGNHEYQGTYRSGYISERVSASKNSVYVDYLDDNLTGEANYFINVKDGTNTVYRLYIVDSNSYALQGITYDYDVIHQNQLDHVKKINDEEGTVPGLLFFHIPFVEYQDAYDMYQTNPSIGQGENLEKCCVPYENNGAFQVFKDINVKGAFCGHDHINYSDIEYEGMILSYGVKATPNIYYEEGKIGCKTITLHKDGSLKLSDIEVHNEYEY